MMINQSLANQPVALPVAFLLKESQQQHLTIQALITEWEECKKITEAATQTFLFKNALLTKQKIELTSHLAKLRLTHSALEESKEKELEQLLVHTEYLEKEFNILSKAKCAMEQATPLVHSLRTIDDLSNPPKKSYQIHAELTLIFQKLIKD